MSSMRIDACCLHNLCVAPVLCINLALKLLLRVAGDTYALRNQLAPCLRCFHDSSSISRNRVPICFCLQAKR